MQQFKQKKLLYLFDNAINTLFYSLKVILPSKNILIKIPSGSLMGIDLRERFHRDRSIVQARREYASNTA